MYISTPDTRYVVVISAKTLFMMEPTSTEVVNHQQSRPAEGDGVVSPPPETPPPRRSPRKHKSSDPPAKPSEKVGRKRLSWFIDGPKLAGQLPDTLSVTDHGDSSNSPFYTALHYEEQDMADTIMVCVDNDMRKPSTSRKKGCQ